MRQPICVFIFIFSSCFASLAKIRSRPTYMWNWSWFLTLWHLSSIFLTACMYSVSDLSSQRKSHQNAWFLFSWLLHQKWWFEFLLVWRKKTHIYTHLLFLQSHRIETLVFNILPCWILFFLPQLLAVVEVKWYQWYRVWCKATNNVESKLFWPWNDQMSTILWSFDCCCCCLIQAY